MKLSDLFDLGIINTVAGSEGMAIVCHLALLIAFGIAFVRIIKVYAKTSFGEALRQGAMSLVLALCVGIVFGSQTIYSNLVVKPAGRLSGAIARSATETGVVLADAVIKQVAVQMSDDQDEMISARPSRTNPEMQKTTVASMLLGLMIQGFMALVFFNVKVVGYLLAVLLLLGPLAAAVGIAWEGMTRRWVMSLIGCVMLPTVVGLIFTVSVEAGLIGAISEGLDGANIIPALAATLYGVLLLLMAPAITASIFGFMALDINRQLLSIVVMAVTGGASLASRVIKRG